FDPSTIARHIHLAATLTPHHPCELAVTEMPQEHFELTIVGYDYFAAFATICGVLSAFGLSIEAGQIYTFLGSPSPSTATTSGALGGRWAAGRGLGRKKLVDVFGVQPVRGAAFGREEHNRLAVELSMMVGFLHAGQIERARQAVNRQLVEQLGKRRGSFSGLLHPDHITFGNSQSPTDTSMDIRTCVTPAVIYECAHSVSL